MAFTPGRRICSVSYGYVRLVFDEPRSTAQPVPWKTIFASIFAVVAVAFGILLLRELGRILTWVVVAAFLAVALAPVVDILQRRGRVPRGAAVLTVFVVGLALVGAMGYAFVKPVVTQSQQFADNFPRYVADAKAGRGPLGHLVRKYNLDQKLEQNQAKLKSSISGIGQNSLKLVRGVGNALAATVTIFVLTVLMLLEGPKMLQGGLNALPPPRRERVRRVAADCSKAVTGYMAGNLLISVIAGTATYVFLLAAGVPFRGVLALWVAFADLIPLVGATLGAVVTVGVAFLHSTPAGIAAVIFFVLYQQFENHVLQVTIMARTVALNPLAVLVSVLAGVELFGLLGALLAIPVAGMIQVIVRDVWDERHGRPKPEPTVGADEIPLDEASTSVG
jgi:predicted PurR-regulated permease PerM